MAEIISIAASPRDRAGKGAARATRRQGLVPGVVYGDKKAPTLIALDPRIVNSQYRKTGFYTHVFDIAIENGKTERAMARDVQLHPVSDQPLHIDFMRISADSVLTVVVPVVFANETKSPGLKRGGVLNIVRHSVEVVCRPDNIPNEFVFDLSGLEIGTTIHVSATTMPEGVRTVIERDFTIASIAAPTVKTGDAEGADAAATEE